MKPSLESERNPTKLVFVQSMRTYVVAFITIPKGVHACRSISFERDQQPVTLAACTDAAPDEQTGSSSILYVRELRTRRSVPVLVKFHRVHERVLMAENVVQAVPKVVQDIIAHELRELKVKVDSHGNELKTEVASLRREMDQRFEAADKNMNQRFEGVNQRFDSHEKQMEQRFVAVDQRFEAVDQRFEAVNQRFDSLEKNINHRFEHAETMNESRHKELLAEIRKSRPDGLVWQEIASLRERVAVLEATWARKSSTATLDR
jgi:hypothetical protein